jgi:hypothetical protein
MSWLFSRALVEASLQDSCSGGEPFAQLNVMPTPHKFWRNDKTIEHSNLSRFGLTCRLLTEHLGADVLMWCQEASRARTSALQGSAQVSTENAAACGDTWHGWLARFDPASCSWKTAQRSFIEDSDECLETFPRWGSMRAGLLWEQPTLTPRTRGTGSGLWPTPVADDTGQRTKKYAQSGTPLSLAVRIFPTPTAGNSKSGGYLAEWGGSGARKAMAELVSPDEMFGPLNPTWVEWLMGWPTGWTDLKPLETDKSHSAQQQPSECSQQPLTEDTHA